MCNNIGVKIYGFCNGFFGRDDYEDKIIEAEGMDWIVCRYINDEDKQDVSFASFENSDEKNGYIKDWSIEELIN